MPRLIHEFDSPAGRLTCHTDYIDVPTMGNTYVRKVPGRTEWLLDGAPVTGEQAEELMATGLMPVRRYP